MKKKIIHLTEAQLQQVVRDKVEETIDTMHSELRIEDYFDLSKINKNKIRSIASDMRVFIPSLGYGSPLSLEGELLFEEETQKTLPIEQLRRELSKLGFQQWQIKTTVIANKVRVVILYADFAKNTEVITNEMLSFGWTRVHISAPAQIQGIMCRAMDFDPLEQPSITDDARKFQYLYHWTPSANLSSILANGIEPRSENEFLSYPPKVHLMKGDISPKTASYLGWQLYNRNSKVSNGDYSLLMIDMNNVPKDIEFYGDPRFQYGYFTKETIPPSAIKLCGNIKYTDKQKFNNEVIMQI